MRITRLFDVLQWNKETHDTRKMLSKKTKGEGWKSYSIDDYINKANTISYALLQLGVKKGDKIAVIASNSPEWNFLDMGIQQTGAIMVPIYPTISPDEYLFIFNKAEIRFVFSEGLDLLHKLKSIIDNAPSIEEVFTFVPRNEGNRSLEDLYKLGEDHPQPELLDKIKSELLTDDAATIIFTSGTTGDSKGVILSHANIIGNMFGLHGVPTSVPGDVALSFLPLCHVYERTVNYYYQTFGYQINYVESMATIAADAIDVKANMMVSVPRVIEKLYDKMYTAGTKLPYFKKKIYFWAFRLAKRYTLNQTLLYKIQHKIADKLIYKKLRMALGGEVKTIISGGAAIPLKLIQFINGIGILCLEGYGMTETSPVITVNRFDKFKFGTVGFPMPDVEVTIAPDDEILVRGYSVMKGYINAPEETALAVDENGFMHTGDLGHLEDGFLVITGRKKSIFKTSFGKFVNPLKIEEKFKESPFIDQIMVVGEGQKFPAAIITLNWEFVAGWWKRKKLGKYPTDRKNVLEEHRLKTRIQREVRKYNAFFGKTEQVGQYRVIADDWTPDDGQLSQTLKVRRNIVEPAYKEIINQIFNSQENED